MMLPLALLAFVGPTSRGGGGSSAAASTTSTATTQGLEAAGGQWAWESLLGGLQQPKKAAPKPLDLRPVTRVPTFRVHGPGRRFKDVLGSKREGETAAKLAQIIEEYLGSQLGGGGIATAEDWQGNGGGGETLPPQLGPSVEVQSAEELRGMLEGSEVRGTVSLVSFGAKWCRLCKVLEPDISTLHARYAPRGMALLNVNVDKVGTLKPGKTGLLAAPEYSSAEDEEAIKNCSVCEGSGFIPCQACRGRGAVERQGQLDGGLVVTMMVTCQACVGYTRLRCPSCGGRCLMCE